MNEVHSARVSADQQPDLTEYRKALVDAERKSQEDFDKTVLSLSGGALGISFVFLKDVIGSEPVHSPSFLLGAWVLWALSSLAVLISFYTSHLALRVAIAQVDAGNIHVSRPGGLANRVTAGLNALGAIAFFLGVCSITLFAGENLKTKEKTSARQETAATTAATEKAGAVSSQKGGHTDTR